ncbi:MAG: DUF2846 domain-containing protein [Pseudomonadota bacterium]
MRHLKALFGATLALLLAACSNPQFLLSPFSHPKTTQIRDTVTTMVDTSTFKPLVWGSFFAPAEGAFFKPVLPTDSRNAVVYVYRPQSSWNDAELQAPGFFLNGKFLSGLKSGAYFWFEVPASSYYFSAKRPLTVFYLNTIFETDVTFEGGRSYYFRYDEEKPGPKKRNKNSPLVVIGPLQQMPDAQGRLEVAQARFMGVGTMLLADEQPQWAPFDFYADARAVDSANLDVTSKIPGELSTDEEMRRALVRQEGTGTALPEEKPKKRWWNVSRGR